MLKKVFFTDEETTGSNRDWVLQEDAENAEHESNGEVLREIERKKNILEHYGIHNEKKGLKNLTLRRQN